jgi:DNA-binding LacI/PurR family transcriptional regulator
MSRRVTIADVAEAAGVSPTSVSFAFNKPEQLSDDTVSRIRQVAIELGYVPNPLARALIAKRVGVLGVLMPQALSNVLANAYFHSFLQGISSMCDEAAVGMLTVSPINGSLETALTRSPVDGFVIVGFDETHHQVGPLQKRGVPYVVVDGDARRATSINVDDEGGAFLAAQHLLANGHRDVLVLMLESAFGFEDGESHGVGRRRLAGYRRAFAQHGVAFRDGWVIPTASTPTGGERAFDLAYGAGLRPTAILAASDAIAMGATKAAFRAGVDVPRDIEVIGFDNISISEMTRPALSTVHQPIFEKGRLAIEVLLNELDGKRVVERTILPTRLILRETTRATMREGTPR